MQNQCCVCGQGWERSGGTGAIGEEPAGGGTRQRNRPRRLVLGNRLQPQMISHNHAVRTRVVADVVCLIHSANLI